MILVVLVVTTERYNAPRTFHDLLVIDVGVVTHRHAIHSIVIHLAVYEVVAGSLHLYKAG